MPDKLTQEQVDEINRKAQEFLAAYKAQPMSEKHLTTNERLDGPVDFRVVEDDDAEIDPKEH